MGGQPAGFVETLALVLGIGGGVVLVVGAAWAIGARREKKGPVWLDQEEEVGWAALGGGQLARLVFGQIYFS